MILNNEMVDEERVKNELSDVVYFMNRVFGLECTLSEIFALRNYVINSLELNASCKRGENYVNPTIEAAIRLLLDYYQIDFWDLWPKRRDGAHIFAIRGFIGIVADKQDPFKVSKEFKEYLRIIQRNSYFP